MKNNSIPKTDLMVSPFCMGTMNFGTPVAEPEAIKLVHYAMDKGVNFIDTANMYEGYTRSIGSAGEVAENILGKALKDRRDEAVLATKVGMKVGPEPEDENTSPAAIRKQLDKSLQRMATDFVDIYYLHRPDPVTPLADIIGALSEAITSGKIKHYGVSNYSAEQLGELIKVADENSLARPVICQPSLSLLKQEILSDLIPLCDKESIAVAPYRILESGLLAGIYKRGAEAPEGSRAKVAPGWIGFEFNDELFDKLESYEKQAEEAKVSIAHYAIRWALKCPAVVSVVLGASSEGHIDKAITAVS